MVILEMLFDLIVDLLIFSVPRQARIGCTIIMLLVLIGLFALLMG